MHAYLPTYLPTYLQIYVRTYVRTYIHTIPYHTIPYHTIPYHTIQYHTIPYNTIQYRTIPYNTIALHYITLHYITYISQVLLVCHVFDILWFCRRVWRCHASFLAPGLGERWHCCSYVSRCFIPPKRWQLQGKIGNFVVASVKPKTQVAGFKCTCPFVFLSPFASMFCIHSVFSTRIQGIVPEILGNNCHNLGEILTWVGFGILSILGIFSRGHQPSHVCRYQGMGAPGDNAVDFIEELQEQQPYIWIYCFLFMANWWKYARTPIFPYQRWWVCLNSKEPQNDVDKHPNPGTFCLECGFCLDLIRTNFVKSSKRTPLLVDYILVISHLVRSQISRRSPPMSFWTLWPRSSAAWTQDVFGGPAWHHGTQHPSGGCEWTLSKYMGARKKCKKTDQSKAMHLPPARLQLLLNSPRWRWGERERESQKAIYTFSFFSPSLSLSVCFFLFSVLSGRCKINRDGSEVTRHSKSWMTTRLNDSLRCARKKSGTWKISRTLVKSLKSFAKSVNTCDILWDCCEFSFTQGFLRWAFGSQVAYFSLSNLTWSSCLGCLCPTNPGFQMFQGHLLSGGSLKSWTKMVVAWWPPRLGFPDAAMQGREESGLGYDAGPPTGPFTFRKECVDKTMTNWLGRPKLDTFWKTRQSLLAKAGHQGTWQSGIAWHSLEGSVEHSESEKKDKRSITWLFMLLDGNTINCSNWLVGYRPRFEDGECGSMRIFHSSRWPRAQKNTIYII